MWDKLKGMLVEDDEPTKTATAPQAPGKPAVAAPTAIGTAPTFTSSVNQPMFEALRKAVLSRNTALTNLLTQAENFADVIPDPVMRLKAAHKASGARSAKDISDAVAIHLADVDGQVLQFNQTLNAKIQTEVGGLQRQADQTEQSITAMQNEIATLSQRIQGLQTTIGENTSKLAQLRTEAATKENELRQAENDFKVAADAVRAELNGHKNTITSTLG